MTSKEALEKMKELWKHNDWSTAYIDWNVLERVIKDLETLEKLIDIINYKQFNGYTILDTTNVEEYNNRIRLSKLDQEEYDLLKATLTRKL